VASVFVEGDEAGVETVQIVGEVGQRRERVGERERELHKG
jgi:hypothetical protein